MEPRLGGGGGGGGATIARIYDLSKPPLLPVPCEQVHCREVTVCMCVCVCVCVCVLKPINIHLIIKVRNV